MAMAAKRRKGSISEDDVSLLLHRYTPTTILTLLQEVSQQTSAKIDWKAIVKRTSTGITCAREYQMLWRHLAYRDVLLEKIENGAEPLDDESDLEFELEAVPAPNEEQLSEAATCVKVLISSGSGRELIPIHRINTEAPSGQNIPKDKMVRVPSDKQLSRISRGTNVMCSVFDQKQSVQMGSSVDPLDGNGPPKKKPKKWTKEEDMELTAAVQKYGEKWSAILNGDYKHDRTPLQLEQRWVAISKRQGSINQNNSKSTTVASSEERKAAQKAFSMALDMPMSRGLSSLRPGASQPTTQYSSAPGAIMSEGKPVTAHQPVNQLQKSSNQVAAQKVSNPSNKPRNASKKQVTNPNVSVSSSSIQAAAIAAGGRIATPSTAAHLLKAAQSKNAVHIRSRAVGPSKSLANSKPSIAVGEHGTQPANAQHVEPPTASSAPTGTPSVLVTHRTLQGHGGSVTVGVNPLANSTAARDSETRQTFGATAIGGSHEHTDQDNDSDVVVIGIKKSFTGGTRDDSMREFDRYVASLDKGKIDKDASEARTIVKDQPKLNKEPSLGNNKAAVTRTAAAEKKPIASISDVIVTSTLTETSGGTGVMGNGSVQNQTAQAKPDALAINDNQRTLPKEQNELSKDIEMSKDAEVGTKPPTDNQADAAGGGNSTNA